MNWLRVFFAGGATSYKALFAWMSPWLFVPMLVVYPLSQILFFAYLGRTAHVGSDSFFLIGDSFVAAAVTGLFGMGHSIGGERRFQTLPILLASPANRLALFLGRAVPTILNGFAVAALSLALGAWILHVHLAATEIAKLALALLISCFACAGLGLCFGALGLRGRSVSLFADTTFAGLLLISGANVPVARLPAAVRTIASFVPLSHGIAAARQLAAGQTIRHVVVPLTKELAIGAIYLAAGLLLLRLFERQGRVSGSLDRF